MMGRIRRFTALSLRLWTLGTRFLLIFFLAIYLPPSDVGLYGLLVATIGYVVYILGMDMYTYTTRELLKADREAWPALLRSHSVFLGWVHVGILPLLLLLFLCNLLPWQVAGWFYLLAISEHFSLELDRILVAMSDQLAASIVVFIRQALLPTLVVPMVILLPWTRDLAVVLSAWVFFNVCALIVGLWLISRKLRGAPPGILDWQWIRSGLAVSLSFLAGSLCLRVLFAADRQVIAVVEDLEVLGAYTFAMSIGLGLSSALSVTVFQFAYPKLVQSAHQNDHRQFRREMTQMSLQTLSITVVVAVASILLKDFLVGLVGGGIYAEYNWLIPASVGVYALYNFSLIPHYALYALHADRHILVATLLSLTCFVAAAVTSMLSGVATVTSMLIALSTASLALSLMKWISYRILLRRRMMNSSSSMDAASI